jgi:hypothetical protein
VCDLVGEPLLHLEPAREHVDDARDLRQADDASARDVCDVHLAEERQQVMLAHRVHLDVLHDHHVAVVLLEDAVADRVLDGHGVAARQPAHAARDALRRAQQSVPLRILAQQLELLAHQRRVRVLVLEAVLRMRHVLYVVRRPPRSFPRLHEPVYST